LVESGRKQSTTSKPSKRNFLELFPPTFDEKLSEMVNETTKTHLTRTTPKEVAPLFVDPEKHDDPEGGRSAKKPKEVKIVNVSMGVENEGGEMNITFYNAKSSSLPPIYRPF
jgi:hypothetical protein